MSGRNKAPSENTIRMLCGKAAGMCEFKGCNKRLFYDNLTLSNFNNAYVAHIIASSANGPRGDKDLSPKLSDKIDNLMLMCADHHKLIDTNVENYPVEKLKDMKEEHEKRIEKICSLFNIPETEIIRFTSPIKGTQLVIIDYNVASKAILPNKQPASTYGQNIFVNSLFDYKTEQYWDDCFNKLKITFESTIFNRYTQMNNTDYSVFPIAPIPLIIKLGELFGDKVPCDIYQKTRVPDTWEWQSRELTNKFIVESNKCNNDNIDVALVISLTNDISYERIQGISDFKSVYKIRAKNLGVDSIKSVMDLSEFWHQYQNVCDEILNLYGKNVKIHLFPAMPVSAAFEIGRRYMPNVYPQIIIYDECDGFFKTLILGG